MLRSDIRLLVLVAAAACTGASDQSPTLPHLAASADGITAELVDGKVRVTNGTDAPVAYTVVDEGFVGLLAQCAEPSGVCTRLAVGRTQVVESSEIGGFGSTGTILVLGWHVVPGDADEYRATDVRTLRLAVR